MISENGIALVESSEGLSLFTYKDGAGIPTIGFGHKLTPGETFPDGITREEAQLLLKGDLAEADTAVTKQAPQANQNQHDALCDFCYNLGSGSLALLLSHGFNQIPFQIMRWIYVDGRVEPGLVSRRAAELKLFNKEI